MAYNFLELLKQKNTKKHNQNYAGPPFKYRVKNVLYESVHLSLLTVAIMNRVSSIQCSVMTLNIPAI